MTDTSVGTSADSPPDPSAPASVHQQLRALWRELPGLLSDRVDLPSLELQRAVQIARDRGFAVDCLRFAEASTSLPK